MVIIQHAGGVCQHYGGNHIVIYQCITLTHGKPSIYPILYVSHISGKTSRQKGQVNRRTDEEEVLLFDSEFSTNHLGHWLPFLWLILAFPLTQALSFPPTRLSLKRVHFLIENYFPEPLRIQNLQEQQRVSA